MSKVKRCTCDHSASDVITDPYCPRHGIPLPPKTHADKHELAEMRANLASWFYHNSELRTLPVIQPDK